VQLRRPLSSVARLLVVAGWAACLVCGAGVCAEAVFDFGGPGFQWTEVLGLVGTPVGLYQGVTFLVRRPVAGGCAFVVGVAVGVCLFQSDLGQGVGPVWTAPADRAGLEAIGDWVSGDVVVRVRPDAVTAYRLADGVVAWSWAPPGQEVVCAMSIHAAAGTGLLGYGPQGAGCDHVEALDLSAGTPRWSTPVHTTEPDADVDSDFESAGVMPGMLDMTAHAAVLQDGYGWRAVDPTDGSLLWTAQPGVHCTPLRVASAEHVVVAVAQCGSGAPQVYALDSAEGRVLWRTPLPTGSDLDDLAVLSAAPAVVWVDEHAVRGVNAVLSFDATGHVRASIPIASSGDTLEIPLGDNDSTAFAARPAYGALIVDGLLIAAADHPGDISFSQDHNGLHRDATGHLAAYSLNDGTLRWSTSLDDHPDGLALEGSTVWALSGQTIAAIDAATGHRNQLIAIHHTRQIDVADLWHTPAGFALIAKDGTESILTDDAPVRLLR